MVKIKTWVLAAAVLASVVCIGCMGFGAEIGGVVPSDFPVGAMDVSPEASGIWLILAGQGAWGAILFGVLGVIWKLVRPYIMEWTGQRKMDRLYLAVEACVAQTQAVYVDGMKAANADGKLTEAEKEEVFTKCKQSVIAFMQSQGIDVVKEYGGVVVDCLIEFILSKFKVNNALAKAVAVPLPDLVP